MPDSPQPTISRRFWRIGVGLACVLGATGILLAAVLSQGVQHNANRQGLAICSIIKYGEDTLADTARNPRPTTSQQRASIMRFRKLVQDMRATGIHCPPPPPEP